MPRVERSPRPVFHGVLFVLAVLAPSPTARATSSPPPAQKDEATVVAQFELPSMSLAAAQARVWPHRIDHDRGVQLGGIFSGLTHATGDPDNVFYCVSDRGPNDEIAVGSERHRTVLVPEYDPVIYRIAAERGKIRILGEIGLRTRPGRPVTGLPNLDVDEAPYGYDGRTRLTPNPNGLDV